MKVKKSNCFWRGMLAVGLAFGLVLAGCGETQPLVGTWAAEGQDSGRLEFSKDGTGKASSDDISFDFTWTAEKGRLTLKLDIGVETASDYKVAGSTLTVTEEDGTITTYKKEK